jgi:hypothetical protein
MKTVPLLLLAAVLLGCEGDDPSAPEIDVRGNYTLTELTFDPQGSLPQIDLRTRISGSLPRLVLVTAGRAQLVFEEPTTGLVTTANANYAITSAGGVRVDFEEAGSLYRGTFLSRNMTFAYDSIQRSLTFSGTSPDGVDRARLIALAPELQGEQLFDPVPGTLRVVYRVSATQSQRVVH